MATPVLGSLLVSMGRENEAGVTGGGVTVPKEVSVLSSFSSATDGEARTFNGSIELCRADSDASQKVGSPESGSG